MIISIAAIDNKRGIGKNNQIPWHIYDDIARFKKLTMGEMVLMGRRTYNSIGKALLGRINIVVSRNPEFKPKDAIVFDDIEKAIYWSKIIVNSHTDMNLYIIGGEEIYRQTLKHAECILLTKIEGDYDCDTFFPLTDGFHKFSEVHKSENDINFSYQQWFKG